MPGTKTCHSKSYRRRFHLRLPPTAQAGRIVRSGGSKPSFSNELFNIVEKPKNMSVFIDPPIHPVNPTNPALLDSSDYDPKSLHGSNRGLVPFWYEDLLLVI